MGHWRTKTPPSFHPADRKGEAVRQHLARRSHWGKDSFLSLKFNPFRQAHRYYLTLMPCDLKLPEFTTKQRLGGNLLLHHRVPPVAGNLHFKGLPASAVMQPYLAAGSNKTWPSFAPVLISLGSAGSLWEPVNGFPWEVLGAFCLEEKGKGMHAGSLQPGTRPKIFVPAR